MKRFLICFAFCFMQWVGFSFCSSDEPVPAHFTEWKAETVVDESEIDRTGLDAWFTSSTVSMKMPQKTPSAVMMLRLRLREIVCHISFQRSVSKNPMASTCYNAGRRLS